ncbi:MAG: hypothetical protein JWQ35_1910 [Bacteriovoracaceae bacterium]|nr:hypothetical protein [Bacteriovoracaceae bacterium]
MNRFLIIFVSLSLYSCAGRREALQNSVENYVKALRRGDADVALSYVNPGQRINFEKQLAELDQRVMISQVEIKSINPDETMDNAVVTLLLEYFNQSSASVNISKTSFLWKYNTEAKAWLLDSSTPFYSK